MANYLSTAEINLYLGTSGEDSLLSVLNGIATEKINSYLDISTLFSATYTNEEHDFIGGKIFFLKNINPTSINSVNNNSPGVYRLDGRRLELQYVPSNTEQVFNKVKITYIAGYSVIPEDIKAVAYDIVGFLYNNKKSQGIDEFDQGELRVRFSSYGKTGGSSEINTILEGLKKYKKNTILS